MSLLRKPELNTRWKKLLLVAVSLLLLVPCVAAATFAMRLDVETNVQDPVTQEQERKDKEKLEMKERRDRKTEDIKARVAADPELRNEIERKRELEMEMRAVRQAALVRLAKINMDQAIQIASSQQAGKVLVCTLDAKGWEEPGKLARDGVVFYHVIIADEVNDGATHVWVNAVDGSVMKIEKELPRKTRNPEVQ
jgi:uncharacterized membrane protein YkoI